MTQRESPENQRHTSSPHVLSSGVVPVFFKDKEPLFLLLRVYNYWDFPKGIVEAGEDPFDAACRELLEETRLSGAEFKWGKTFRETPPYARGKVARYYVGEVKTQQVEFVPNPITHKVEHHEFGWFSYKEARRILVPRVQTVLDWALELIKAR
jgi:8-oxo-dGTP pyrophosphatase MutT (NUDIX family)